MDWQAMSNATRLLEHAVSICTLGPLRSKYQLRRFGIREEAVPVAADGPVFSGSCETIRDQSSVKEAEKTAVLEPLSFSTGIPATSSTC
jgi:hypothetical protein